MQGLLLRHAQEGVTVLPVGVAANAQRRVEGDFVPHAVLQLHGALVQAVTHLLRGVTPSPHDHGSTHELVSFPPALPNHPVLLPVLGNLQKTLILPLTLQLHFSRSVLYRLLPLPLPHNAHLKSALSVLHEVFAADAAFSFILCTAPEFYFPRHPFFLCREVGALLLHNLLSLLLLVVHIRQNGLYHSHTGNRPQRSARDDYLVTLMEHRPILL